MLLYNYIKMNLINCTTVNLQKITYFVIKPLYSLTKFKNQKKFKK